MKSSPRNAMKTPIGRVATRWFGAATLLSCLILLLSGSSRSQAAAGDEFWDDEFGVPGLPGLPGSYTAAGPFITQDGRTYISGGFDSIGGIAATNLAIWQDGRWDALVIPWASSLYTWIPYQRGFLAMGSFPLDPPQPNYPRVAYWDGTTWTNITGKLTAPYPIPALMAALPVGQDVYACGTFDSIGGVQAQNIARWDGSKWNPLGSGIVLGVSQGEEAPFYSQYVTHLVWLNGSLYAAGFFNFAGGKRANNIARWDGTNWYPLAEGLRLTENDPVGTELGRVRAVTTWGNDLVVAGNFQLAGQVPARGVARWDGQAWHAMGAGFPARKVIALAAAGNRVFAGGLFEGICEPHCVSYLAQWDGEEWTSLGQGLNGQVATLGADEDHLFVYGGFGLAGGKPSQRIALWHLPIDLTTEITSTGLAISWPAERSYVALEQSRDVGGKQWQAVEFTPEVREGKRIAHLPLSGERAFYRLRQK